MLIISPVYVYILGTSYFVTPLLSAGVHAGIEVCVVENNGVCIKHSSDSRAAAVGQNAAEHLFVPVKLLHTFLQGHKTAPVIKLGQSLKTKLLNLLNFHLLLIFLSQSLYLNLCVKNCPEDHYIIFLNLSQPF